MLAVIILLGSGVLTLLVSHVSFCFLEQKFIKLGKSIVKKNGNLGV